MKKTIFALTLLVSVSLFAQSSVEVDLEIKKMKFALGYGDNEVALSKMYNVIALEGDESAYKDSLAYLYYNNRNYLSCFLVSKDVLDRKPDNIEMLEMNTISVESIGATPKAIEGYKSLLAKTKVSVIVKEVGQGMGPESLKRLLSLPLCAVEFAAYGGTNFSKLELLRNLKI